MSLLECRHLAAGHAKVNAVRPLDLDVEAGEVCTILGPNGAGKTTLLSTLAGLLPNQGGTVTVAGSVLASGRGAAASSAGVVLVPDDRALFTTLNVRDNLAVAARNRKDAVASVLDLFPALKERWKVAAGMLSGGEQQMLAVARALVQQPTVLLIDEMSMGLAPIIVQQLLPVVRRIADETGAAVVLVEQHVRLALEVADHAVVLVHGDVALRGPARELAANPQRIEAAYLGEAVTA